MNRLLRPLLFWLLLAAACHAHVVTQLYAEWQETDGVWTMDVQFEAGYAEPAIRENPTAPAPDRDWLLAQGETRWRELRQEAERFFRTCFTVTADGQPVEWTVDFPDFSKSPPDFPKLLTNGAYMRMIVRPVGSPPGALTLAWAQAENRPTFVLKMDGAQGGYLTFEPGTVHPIATTAPGNALWTAFRQGFLHVVPKGWDHVLFVIGLFFYRRKWKPLLSQSLAFTAAHTVTLGLAAAGIVTVTGNWVEPLIALSIAAVALENLRPERETKPILRLAVVFGFGLIHGLGFAGALSAWLKPGEGFLPSLLSANLGVEAAQAALLAAAWILTLGWNGTRTYRIVRLAACLAISAIGLYWTVTRIL